MSLFDPVKKVLYFAGKSLHKNMPTILSVIACGGVVGTAVVSGKAHHKAMQKLEESEPRPLETPTEKVVREAKVVAPHYILPAVVGGCTIALILGSNALNKKQQAALYGALFALDKSYRTYREKITDIYGEDADVEVRKAVAKDSVHNVPKPTSSDQVLFYEENSDDFFWSTLEQVQRAEYYLNKRFKEREEASLNDFLLLLGRPKCEFGDVLGWNEYDGEVTYGYYWIDFDNRWVHAEEIGQNDMFPPLAEEMADLPGYYYIHTPFAPHVPSDDD